MNSPAALPAGFLAAPVSDVDAGAPLRLCAVLRRTPDPVAGALVGLGDGPDAARLLGCVTDRGGRVREWLEWSVQSVGFPAASASAETLNNAALDAGWTARAQAWRDLAPELFVETGWESAHPAPMFLDPAGGEPLAAKGWELCRDDAALAAAGYPTYTGSLHRYLWSHLEEPPTFLPVTPDAPEAAGVPPAPAKTGTVGEVFGSGIPFNPAAGLLMARTFLPLGLEAFADALGGQPWVGLPQGTEDIPLGRAYEALRRMEEPEFAGGHLFSIPRGRAGRLAEVFHLKLHLLLDAAREVRGLVAATRLPLLDLSTESFRVRLDLPASGLPFLWTAKSFLARPGTAVAVTIPTTGEALRYFLPAPGGASRYRPAAFARLASGRGTVRLRTVRAAAGDLLEISGTLIADENLPETVSDLLRLQLRLGNGARADLFGHLETKEGLAAGEARFRTVPQRFPEAVATSLNAAAGTTFASTFFELLPLLGSPCDLYALGVLAVRLLLVNDANTLAEALDETLSLARQAGGVGTNVSLELRLETLFGEDARWSAALGAHRLLRAGMAADTLPPDLWWATLAAVVRCFPGMGPDSHCRDLGDAPPGAPEAVFDRLIHDLEALTGRTRSLVVIDWQQNREIRAAIRRAVGG